MNRFFLFLCLGFPGLLSAAGWAPIPPAVWAMKPVPEGAVVLEQRWRFNRLSVDYVYRVRIFSEAGRKAAQVPDVPGASFAIKGRTVYPDGREVAFNSRRDFAEIRTERGWRHASAMHLIPPGITSDCVMEVSWSEQADGGLQGLPYRFNHGLYMKWPLAGAYPVASTVIEVVRPFGLAVRVVPEGFPPPERSEAYEVLTLRLGPLPAMPAVPFTLPPLQRWPYLEVYAQPNNLDLTKGPKRFWEEVVENVIRDAYEGDITTGTAFRKLSAELTAGLPPGALAAARELLTRLEGRIVDVSEPTFKESATLPKDFLRGLEPHDLEAAARRGWTDAAGMRLLFYHLLKAAGIHPRLAKVPDRQVHLFAWSDLNLFQLDHDLIGVEEPGKGLAWFDPALRFARPGVVHPDYTAVPALMIDTVTWEPSPGVVLGLGPSEHSSAYDYRVTMDAEGDRFDFRASFSGFPDCLARQPFLRLGAAEQSKVLRERFEKGRKDLTVSQAEVQHAADPKAGVTWRVAGFREQAEGRSRTVSPFPALPMPLEIPDGLEPTRTVPIVLPFPLTQTAESTVTLQPGYRLEPLPNLERQNVIGEVSRKVAYDAGLRQAKVSLRIVVRATFFGPDRWQAFREFLAWVGEACGTRLPLVKDGTPAG